MPKSKLRWKNVSGRVYKGWNGDEKELISKTAVPKGYRFFAIEWSGKRFTIKFVSGS